MLLIIHQLGTYCGKGAMMEGWEHLVRSIKNCIRKTVGFSTLNFEDLNILLIEVEATLNNRPLTYLYDDENSISYPLTPASLIYG